MGDGYGGYTAVFPASQSRVVSSSIPSPIVLTRSSNHSMLWRLPQDERTPQSSLISRLATTTLRCRAHSSDLMSTRRRSTSRRLTRRRSYGTLMLEDACFTSPWPSLSEMESEDQYPSSQVWRGKVRCCHFSKISAAWYVVEHPRYNLITP